MSIDVALIGAGVMGEAILASLTQAVGADRVRVSDARAAAGEQVAARHQVRWCAETADAVAGAAVVIIAVKPQDVAGVLGAARPAMDTAAVVVSVAAGIPTSFVEQHLDPGTAAVRVMPNTPATIGAGVSVLSPGTHATTEDLDLVSTLLAGTGHTARVPEQHQDVVTAISGSGPAYVFYLIEALAEAGVLGGLSREVALDLARRTVAGAGAMAAQSQEHPAVLRERVSSPGGTTMAALAELDDRAVRAAVVAAARRAWERAAELGQDLPSD